MHVAVLGASGRAGSEIVKELVSRGHSVLAVARKPEAIAAGESVTAVAGDASDPEALAEVIKGVDAVISAIHFDVSADTLLSAVKKAGVKRLLITGGAASLNGPDGVMLYDSPNFPENIKPFVLPAIHFLNDIRKETEVDWTFFSPAMIIFEGPRIGTFRLGGDELVSDANGESKISFADYAIAMVDELEQHRHSRARFTAAY
ncbi:3-beta hydroxysteroid dehydrogenase [Erythrobacter sp. SG61-1L]|uniref:NAD(P)-dependent oxidoreductase n=1 Tax=Erythrobacter sp. SG61-1L TaxID=1603897 RepID=UPI0006C93826|nr:NAD(P)H-binding protein [Erythrobacter sp. SG61-1L]KPL67862.1 3-beta hydroxysteroid dehydrogenase [Erythrobacter sp. SG61-1L]